MQTLIQPAIQSTVTSILDSAFQTLKQGNYNLGIQSLTFQLKKILDSVGSDVLYSEVKEQCVSHPIKDLIFQDPCTYRSFSKPNGYAGDANLIDYIYGLSSFSIDTTYPGRKIFQANVSSSSTESVRWRANHLAQLIDDIQAERGNKIDVLSVASGRCRELALVKNSDEKLNSFTCLDQDVSSNDLVRKNYPYDYLKVLDESILFLIKNGLKEQQYDFVYSAGLFDYLEKKLAAKLIQKLYARLKSDGYLLIPNFAPGLIEQGYMETFMDWKLIYRTEEEMMELAELAEIPTESVKIYRDPMYNVVYMGMSK